MKNDIESAGFVEFNLLSPSKGHIKEPMEVTIQNKDLVHKWLDKETNSIYCLEIFRDGEPQYYYTTKEIFQIAKNRFDEI